MGNCTSSDIKSQALDSNRVQETRPVKRELKELFDEKKVEGVHEAVQGPAVADAVQKDVEEVPQLGDAVADAAAPDAVSDAPESAAAESESEHQGIAALRRVSPRAHGLSLLQAAGETPSSGETPADAEAEAVVDAVADAALDAEGEDAPKEGFASKLVVETDAEPQAVTTRELECESPASPASPAVWVPDDSTKACQCCGSDFTFVRRRHHCRACGEVVCNSCSNSRKVVPDMGHTRPVRCCDRCVEAKH